MGWFSASPRVPRAALAAPKPGGSSGITAAGKEEPMVGIVPVMPLVISAPESVMCVPSTLPVLVSVPATSIVRRVAACTAAAAGANTV